jgi:hypothetical protein
VFQRVTVCAVLAGAVCLPGLFAAPAHAQVGPAPVKMQAAVFLKLLAFHKGLAASDGVTVHVVGDSGFAAELSRGIGRPIGTSTLKEVTSGAGRPERKPSVLYIGDARQADALLKYTHDNDVLSITGIPELRQKGVTLTVCIRAGTLKVYFDAEGSAEEGAAWESGLFKVVEDKN